MRRTTPNRSGVGPQLYCSRVCLHTALIAIIGAPGVGAHRRLRCGGGEGEGTAVGVPHWIVVQP